MCVTFAVEEPVDHKESMTPLTFEQYQKATARTAIYPGHGEGTLVALSYCALGLAGEAGEVANKIKKLIRDEDSPYKRSLISKEIGDCLWYVSQLLTELGQGMEDSAWSNVQKLEDRKVRGVLQGNGDNR